MLLANNPAEIVWNGFFARGYVLPEGTDAERFPPGAWHGAHEQMQASVLPAYLDGRVFMLYGDCPALVYGPQSENVHGFDERVSIDQSYRSQRPLPCSLPDGAAPANCKRR